MTTSPGDFALCSAAQGIKIKKRDEGRHRSITGAVFSLRWVMDEGSTVQGAVVAAGDRGTDGAGLKGRRKGFALGILISKLITAKAASQRPR